MADSTHPDTHALTRRGAIALAAAATTTALAAPASAGGRHGHHRLPDTVALPDGLRPEGITSGPGTTFYVGSLSDGRIVTGDLLRRGTRVLLPGATGRSLRGLYRDPRSRLVWAAGGLGAAAHVWAVDGSTGAVVAAVAVPGGVFLNDLVVTERAVWVTDSRVDRLTRIALTRRGLPLGTAPTFVPLTGEWPAFDGTNIAANGIRELPDGSLVLNNSRAGGLWRVDAHTGATRELVVRGGPGLVGGDGLELRGRTLYDVRGSGPAEVAVLALSRRRRDWVATWRGALTDPTLDVPSTATWARGSLWAVNARFGVPSPDTASYWVTRLPAR
ncbi:MAG TPA: hypothetical protein VES93_04055 [Ornithinibacter sp.]|nr:hypothetical protein [Ornithinibacter sp.]